MTALTNRQAVRLRAGDSDEDNQLLTDDEVDYFLSEQGDNVLMAAADALDALAANSSHVAKMQKTLNLTIDRKAIPGELRKQAQELRKQARSTPSAYATQVAASQTQAEQICATAEVAKRWDP